MNARIRAMRLERWREIIVACNTSGMKKNEWMRIHNIGTLLSGAHLACQS